MEPAALDDALIGEGVADPLREDHGGPGLVSIPVGIGPGQAVVLGMAAAELQGLVIVVFVAGVPVDNLRAVDGGLLDRSAALAEGVGVDNEDLVVVLVEKLLGAHAADVGIGAEPLLVDAVDQVVVVVLREAELRPQNHVQPHLVAPALGGVVAAEIMVHHLIPIVFRVNAGKVFRMQVVRDHQAGEAAADVAVHHVGGVEVAAAAGFGGVGMGIVAVAVHSENSLFPQRRKPLKLTIYAGPLRSRQVLRLISAGIRIWWI